MGKRTLMTVVVGLILAMVASTGLADALTDAADKLVTDQISSGDPESSWGSWPDEPNFAAESTIGLCHAYELTKDAAYKNAAVKAGNYSLASAGYDEVTGGFSVGLLRGPEAYAMARLSAIDENPAAENRWRLALQDTFFGLGEPDTAIGTIRTNSTTLDENTVAVYSLARLAVSAEYAQVESQDLSDWRGGVVASLGDLDQTYCPVKALGSAVWALASTGDISQDETVVWTGVEEADNVLVKHLPGMLKEAQADDGSFYSYLGDLYPGYTEPTVMGTLGLQAADADLYSTQIADAVGVLEGGVDTDGTVYWIIGGDPDPENTPAPLYFAAGETLEVIPEPATMTLLLVGAVGMIRRRRSKQS